MQMKKNLFLTLIFLTSCNIGVQPPTPIQSPATQTPLNTPLPVTATETFILPPTASPTPQPPPRFFTDEFTTTSPYWIFSQTGGQTIPTTTFENDILRINFPSPDTWMIGINNAHTYNNVFIQTQATISPTGSFGLICRYDAKLGWYEFNVYSDGTYNLLYGKQLTEGVAKYIPLSTEFSGHITPSSLIGLHCQDNSLLLYVNDNLVKRVDVTNYGLGEGQIGLTASSVLESPINISFEWIKVSEQ